MVWLRVRRQDKGPGQVMLENGLQTTRADDLGRVAASLHEEAVFAVKVALYRAQAKLAVSEPRAALV